MNVDKEILKIMLKNKTPKIATTILQGKNKLENCST